MPYSDLQQAFDLANNLRLTGHRLAQRYVHRQDELLRGQPPDVDVMNFRNVRHPGHDQFLHGVDIEPLGRAFQQHMRTAFDQRPGAFQNQRRDRHRQQRVDQGPARVNDHDGRNDGGNRTQQVTRHVQGSSAHVEVVLVASVQHNERNQVDHQARDRDDEHRLAEHVTRVDEAPRGLEQDPADHRQQTQAVDEGGKDLESLVAISQRAIRRSFAHMKGHGRQRQRHRVGEHVAGVGQQRQ